MYIVYVCICILLTLPIFHQQPRSLLCCFMFRKAPGVFLFNSKIRGPFEVNLSSHGSKAVKSTPFSSGQFFWVSEILPRFLAKGDNPGFTGGILKLFSGGLSVFSTFPLLQNKKNLSYTQLYVNPTQLDVTHATCELDGYPKNPSYTAITKKNIKHFNSFHHLHQTTSMVLAGSQEWERYLLPLLPILKPPTKLHPFHHPWGLQPTDQLRHCELPHLRWMLESSTFDVWIAVFFPFCWSVLLKCSTLFIFVSSLIVERLH